MGNILTVRKLEAWYGESKALHGINFNLPEGEVVTLLGRNGAGKSTTLMSIMGLVSSRKGSIQHQGEELISARPFEIARKGIAFCPEERGIFASLSVRENLLLPPAVTANGMTVDDILDLFPNLRERIESPGTKLSGGEQQMLALARILRTGAKVLLLDEPTEGLAPIIIKQIENTIIKLKELGFTILLVEQNVGFAHALADRNYIVETGSIVDEVPAADFERRLPFIQSYLGL
ncbi:ATP-binding cassette domain-containing protein [Sinorhizobium medicae]|nr:ATP-binding cassette domain-containing protein [Sinorhizobium medicae]MDX0444520.1 ATP-binding cassette domain-containing protein [Sinorhizobium medicae]MDX0489796.1 ATP-binding cassette domain-containing protein [Sinorhizobium medicae]MDX0523622.1 ATP-binding cassette domain-containing protein [Sinorhizobium medicae]MDX0539575.1 ATP-binding cassette domain-containing protein [Sinorhizobium medicae]